MAPSMPLISHLAYKIYRSLNEEGFGVRVVRRGSRELLGKEGKRERGGVEDAGPS